jgi:hypothetical protein
MRLFSFMFLLAPFICGCSDDESSNDGGGQPGGGQPGGAGGTASAGGSPSGGNGGMDPEGGGGGAPPDPSERFYLDFPSNVTGGDQSAPFVALQYDDPHLDGLPFAGPADAGVTYMWRINQRAQTGYYVTLWWSQGDGGFTPAHQYVGGHPYPKVGNNTGTVQRWEIAAPSGGDYFDTRAGLGTSKDVVYGVWRCAWCAMRIARKPIRSTRSYRRWLLSTSSNGPRVLGATLPRSHRRAPRSPLAIARGTRGTSTSG